MKEYRQARVVFRIQKDLNDIKSLLSNANVGQDVNRQEGIVQIVPENFKEGNCIYTVLWTNNRLL